MFDNRQLALQPGAWKARAGQKESPSPGVRRSVSSPGNSATSHQSQEEREDAEHQGFRSGPTTAASLCQTNPCATCLPVPARSPVWSDWAGRTGRGHGIACPGNVAAVRWLAEGLAEADAGVAEIAAGAGVVVVAGGAVGHYRIGARAGRRIAVAAQVADRGVGA